jgi:hypothetical protein
MRYRITVPIQAHMQIDDPLTADWPPYRLTAAVDDTRLPISLAIDREVTEYADWLPSVDRSGPIPSIRIPDNPAVHDFRDKLEYLCSVGSYRFGIQTMDWPAARHEWLPDTPEEQALLHISSFEQSAQYPVGRAPVTMSASAFRDLLRIQPTIGYLTTPMSFWREGSRQFDQQRYVSAFLNYYLYIESLYAQGKSRTAAVVEAFQRSRQLTDAANRVHWLYNDERHGPNLDPYTQDKEMRRDAARHTSTTGIDAGQVGALRPHRTRWEPWTASARPVRESCVPGDERDHIHVDGADNWTRSSGVGT